MPDLGWTPDPGVVRIPRWSLDQETGIYRLYMCGLELTLSQVEVDPGEWGWSARVQDRGANIEDGKTFYGPGQDLLVAAKWAEDTAVAWDDTIEEGP